MKAKILEIPTASMGPQFEKYGKTMLVHFKANKEVYIQIGKLIVYGSLVALAPQASYLTALASSICGIDEAGANLYYKVLGVGKWVLLVKGVIDVTTHCLQQDFDSAKKAFIGHLLSFAALLALPWAFNEAEAVFKTM